MLFEVFLFLVQSALGELILKWLEFSGLESVALVSKQRGHLELLLRFFEFAAMV